MGTLQGNLQYTKARNEAKQKGVIVNTIYCGDKMQGIRGTLEPERRMWKRQLYQYQPE